MWLRTYDNINGLKITSVDFNLNEVNLILLIKFWRLLLVFQLPTPADDASISVNNNSCGGYGVDSIGAGDDAGAGADAGDGTGAGDEAGAGADDGDGDADDGDGDNNVTDFDVDAGVVDDWTP